MPHFINMPRSPAAELQNLLLKALEEQKQFNRRLRKGTPTEKEINDKDQGTQRSSQALRTRGGKKAKHKMTLSS
jgi:hypothetical protein